MHAFAYGFVDVSGSGRNDVLLVAVIAAACAWRGVVRERIVASKVKTIGRNFFMADAALHVYKLLTGLEDQFRNCRAKEQKRHSNSPQNKVFHVSSPLDKDIIAKWMVQVN